MTTAELVGRLISFGRTNSVESLIAAAPYLEALAEALGDRDVRSVSTRDLSDFHRDAGAELVEPVMGGLKRKSLGWEAIYSSRSRQLLGPLQWESENAVSALVELFGRAEFRPRTVLELGCGDGVNAVFMATRGARVTAIDVSHTALEMARQKQREAGVEIEFIEGDIFGLDPAGQPFDLVFDRGLLHHLPVFRFEDYKRLVADWLAPGGHFHLICHHVSTRPTVALDAAYGGAMGKLLGYLTGPLVETGCGFTDDELMEIFSDPFEVESIELIDDDEGRPFRFQSAVMRRAS
ncbi:MAG TPA: class I SAM-dependent methyltransferase [Solirubrobacterales bacterium]|nr:class I SAM-dependent methyltransferase [Solirubrobacterales bacterium]